MVSRSSRGGHMKRRVNLVIAAILGLATLGACGATPTDDYESPAPSRETTGWVAEETTPSPEPTEDPVDIDLGPRYDVTKVTDGDTIRVNYNGSNEAVRLIAINTPEVDWYGGAGECFGDEAGSFAHDILAGEQVHLVRDGMQDDRDRYGRLLRFVFLSDGTNFNALMVEKGYATYESQYPVAEPFRTHLSDAQATAMRTNAGLLSACR